MTEATTTNERRSRRRVAEGLVILLLLGALGSALTVWRSSSLHDVALEAHRLWLGDHEERIDVLEAPAVVVQVAQATKRLEKLEEGAEVVIENQAAIAGIRATQSAQGRQLERIETAQERQTVLIIRALERAAPAPISTPVPPLRPAVTTDPSP